MFHLRNLGIIHTCTISVLPVLVFINGRQLSKRLPRLWCNVERFYLTSAVILGRKNTIYSCSNPKIPWAAFLRHTLCGWPPFIYVYIDNNKNIFFFSFVLNFKVIITLDMTMFKITDKSPNKPSYHFRNMRTNSFSNRYILKTYYSDKSVH